MISSWYFEIADKQLFVYLPVLVDAGIFFGAVGITVAKMPEDQRRKLIEGLKSFKDSITNLSLAAIFGGGIPGNGGVGSAGEV
jgi:hypothetical protein